MCESVGRSGNCRKAVVVDRVCPTLQALVHHILPSTTAVFSYAIGSRKLSANEQFFVGAQNSSKFVTNTSDKTRRVVYSRQQSSHQHKQNHNRLNRDGTHFLTRGGCKPTLRASLSGTFLQTLPDLVTPLKGHSLSPRSCPPTRSAFSERFGC